VLIEPTSRPIPHRTGLRSGRERLPAHSDHAHTMSLGTPRSVRAFGAEIIRRPARKDESSHCERRRYWRAHPMLHVQQFANPANRKITSRPRRRFGGHGRQGGHPHLRGGTGGTLTGVTDISVRRSPLSRPSPVEPKESAVLSGVHPARIRFRASVRALFRRSCGPTTFPK